MSMSLTGDGDPCHGQSLTFTHSSYVSYMNECRRRLPVVMVRTKMAETLKEAVTFIEQVRSL